MRLSPGSATNPLGPDARPTDSARAAFTGSCATCHGARGDGKGVFGLDTHPNASDLTSVDVKGRSDARADLVAYVNTFDARRLQP